MEPIDWENTALRRVLLIKGNIQIGIVNPERNEVNAKTLTTLPITSLILYQLLEIEFICKQIRGINFMTRLQNSKAICTVAFEVFIFKIITIEYSYEPFL